MAMQMAQLARPWLAYEISGSALMLGVVAGSQGLAQVIAAPFGGLAADRLPKRTVLLVSQIVLLGMVLTMALLVAFGNIQVWELALLSVVHGVTVTFNNPVRQAFIPLLLPRRLLGNGMALHNGARSLNQIIGPTIAGVLLDIHISLAFFVIVGLHATSVMFSTQLPLGEPKPTKKRSVFGELAFGLGYVAQHRVLRLIVLLSIFATILVAPYQQLLPVFQKEVLDVSDSALGLMFAAVGIGALLASLGVASYSEWATKSWSQMSMGVVFGAAVAGFAFSPYYPLSLFALLIAGAAAQGFQVSNSTQMIFHADPALYGRVSGLNIWIRALMSLSLLGYGAIIDSIGASPSLAAGGAAFIGVIAVVAIAFPWFWRGRLTTPHLVEDEPASLS